MIIAAAVNENSINAVIPEVLDRSAGVMIFDWEDGRAKVLRFVCQDIPQALEDTGCEAILCGVIYDAQLFEAIAQAGITRYMAAGMTVTQAAADMDAYLLDLITDYVGGPGCSGHGHEDCDGNCESCTLQQ